MSSVTQQAIIADQIFYLRPQRLEEGAGNDEGTSVNQDLASKFIEY